MATGTIYCMTSPSGKKYVGQTIRKLSKRIKEHETNDGCRLLYNAIKKYGISMFNIEVLKECPISKLDLLEQYYIKSLDTMHPNGYNIRSGGSSKSWHCEDSKSKIRASKNLPYNNINMSAVHRLNGSGY